ncbi:MAG: glycosyltransferase family 2 protein [Acidimicrobiales bacterium]
MTTARPGPVTLDVVMAAYNRADTITAALRSALAQRGADVRVTVVDDAGDDDTADVVVALDDQRVRYLRRESNGGIAAARNTGLDACDREWIAFLDADDIWPPDRTEQLARALTGVPGPSVAVGLVEHFGEHDALEFDPTPTRGLLAGGILLRRGDFDLVGPFDPSLRTGEFVDWFTRAREFGLTEIDIDEIVLRRRVHPSSTAASRRDLRTDYLDTVRAHLSRVRGS